jgi:hypothetical protein
LSTNNTLLGNLTAEESLKGDGLTGPIIALRSKKTDQYVGVKYQEDGMATVIYLSATSTAITDSEKFQLIDRGGNNVAFKSVLNGCYVYNTRLGPGVWVDDDEIGSRAIFEKICDGKGGWAFKAANGKYLCADDGKDYWHNWITANRKDIGPWETFQIEILDRPLQKEIDAIGPGGTINLNEGVYRGAVNIDKPVNLIGAGSGRTVIDGDNKGTVITIGETNSDIDVKLAGVIVRGGLDGHGGGVFNHGRLTIEDVDVMENQATYSGGGIYNYEGSLHIVNSRILRNRAAHQGGGIINYEGTVNMDSGLIEGNIAAYGGGVLNHGLMDMCTGSIINNMALGRSATEPQGEGSGVWNDRAFNFKGGCVSNNRPDNVYHKPRPSPPS